MWACPNSTFCGPRRSSLFFGFKIRPCCSWSHLCKRTVLGDRDHVQWQLSTDKASIHGPHWSAIVDFQFHSAECGRLPLWGWVAKWFSWEKDPEWEWASQSALSLLETKAIPWTPTPVLQWRANPAYQPRALSNFSFSTWHRYPEHSFFGCC